jgi:hypothetical protein
VRAGYLPYISILHTHDDVASVVLEGAVEGDNVLGVAVVHDAQLAHDALADLVLGLDVDNLSNVSRRRCDQGAGNSPCAP